MKEAGKAYYPGKTLLNMAQMPNLLWKHPEEKPHIDFFYFTDTPPNRSSPMASNS